MAATGCRYWTDDADRELVAEYIRLDDRDDEERWLENASRLAALRDRLLLSPEARRFAGIDPRWDSDDWPETVVRPADGESLDRWFREHEDPLDSAELRGRPDIAALNKLLDE